MAKEIDSYSIDQGSIPCTLTKVCIRSLIVLELSAFTRGGPS